MIDLNEVYTKGQGCNNRCVTQTEKHLVYLFRCLKPFQKAAILDWAEKQLAQNDFNKSQTAKDNAQREYKELLEGLAMWAYARKQRKVGWARQRKIEVLTKGY